ncbi:hypothetical protein DD894_12550, partial [Staphylococcus pseudintermedius]
FDVRLPRRLTLLRDQLVRKIQFGFHLMYASIKPNLVEGPAPRKRKPRRQSKLKIIEGKLNKIPYQ